MWRKSLGCLLSHRRFLRSFPIGYPTTNPSLHPSLFAVKPIPPPPPPPDLNPTPPSQTLTIDRRSALETTLGASLAAKNTDEAWRSFRSLARFSAFPGKHLANSLIVHLSSLSDSRSLKRAFASVMLLVEKDPGLLDFESVRTLLDAMSSANAAAPAFDLLGRLFKNRFFVPFSVWGGALLKICQKNGWVPEFLGIFNETCRIASDEKLNFMKPDLTACNVALRGCCCDLESVSDADNVFGKMSELGLRPDELSFGYLAYLYSLKGLEEKLIQLEVSMNGHGFSNSNVLFRNLMSGYAKSGKLESLSGAILRALRVGDGQAADFGGDTYRAIVEAFLCDGNIKDLADLITEVQDLEAPTLKIDESFGFGIVTACVQLASVNKAQHILLHMKAQGGPVGLGVYIPIVKACYEEHRVAEAAGLVHEIRSSGLQLGGEGYDALIEASMASQDFGLAFSLFRDMRDAGISDLNRSYLTMVTVLTENHRPELMAALLDEVARDPRVGVGTHDWNSLIHAFCKLKRMEDARRALLRMNSLRFKANGQTYLSLINGYASTERYFDVLMLWHRVKTQASMDDGERGLEVDDKLVDAFVYALVKGGFFDTVMQIVEKCREWNVFVDRWKYKHAFMENLKDLGVAAMWSRNQGRKGALVAFKNWVGLSE